MEEDFATTFDSFQERIKSRIVKNRKEFPKECAAIEQGISLSLELLKITNSRLIERYTLQNQVPKNVALSYFLFDRGIHYIFATYKLASYGLIDPANETGRVLLEMSLVKYSLLYNEKRILYYDELFPRLEKIFEMINAEKYGEELYELEKEWRELNIKQGTTIRNLAEELYKSPEKENLKLVESVMSIGSHANLTGAGANSNFSPVARNAIIKFLLMLINFHFISFLEVVIPYLEKDVDLLNKISEYDRSVQSLTEGRLIPIPNEAKVFEKLKIIPSG